MVAVAMITPARSNRLQAPYKEYPNQKGLTRIAKVDAKQNWTPIFANAVRTIAHAHVSVKDARYWYAYALLRQLGAVGRYWIVSVIGQLAIFDLGIQVERA
jgi:hypothetical protein